MVCRFGRYEEAEELLRVWLREVASASWPPFLSASAVRGSIGIPSGRCELELEFDDLPSLHEFWENLPQRAHAAWMRQAEVLPCSPGCRFKVVRVTRSVR
jgi:hypothetical protein